MTATRSPLMICPRPHYEQIAIGQTAKGIHGTQLAWLANETRWAGGLLFHLSAPSPNADSSPPRYYVHYAARRNCTRRLWIVGYRTPQIAGKLRIIPAIAPVNSTDDQWDEGRWVQVETDARRAIKPLLYYEVVDTGSHTLPSTSTSTYFDLSWPGSGSTSLEIAYVSCWELSRVRNLDDAYGTDIEQYEARRAVASNTSSNLTTGGVRQLVSQTNGAAFEQCYRKMYDDYNSSGIGSANSEIYSDLFGDIKVRIHPRRLYRNNPGWSYTPSSSHGSVVCSFFGQNSAANTGTVRVKSKYDTSGQTGTGFPVSPSAPGWVHVTVQCYCESCFATHPTFLTGSALASATASARGMLSNVAATDDTDAEGVDRATSEWEETLTIEARGKTAGEGAPNTLTIYGIAIKQI